MVFGMNSPEAIRTAWDARAAQYAESLSRADGRAIGVAVELEHFRRALPKRLDLNLLDAGCGPGFHGRRLVAEGHRVTFVDVSPAMLERAQRDVGELASRAVFIEGDIRGVPALADGSFDGVIAGGTVISDCGHPRAAIAELRRVLRPGGVLGFSVRNLLGPQQRTERTEVVRGGGDGFDWHFFSPESLMSFCQRHSLAVKAIHPVHVEGLFDQDVAKSVAAHLAAELSRDVLARSWELFAIATRKGTPRKRGEAADTARAEMRVADVEE